MIEERLVLRREDFLELRESRRNPQKTSGIISAVKHEGVIYSSGVFPRNSEKSFFKSLEGIDCCEILGDFNSIVIPYICGDASNAFAEILEIHQKSLGMISEFCFARERETRVYTPLNDGGIISLQSVPYAVAGEKRINPKLVRFIKEQNNSLNNYLSNISCTVESH